MFQIASFNAHMGIGPGQGRMDVPSVTLASLAVIVLTGACSAPTAPIDAPQPAATSVHRSHGDGMTDPITFICTPAVGARLEDPDRICSELLEVLTETRPDLRFIAREAGMPSARFVIVRGDSRGLGLEATWIDADGATTVGKPLSVTFFDRPSNPEFRRNFYGAFLKESPIPF